jgi:hypothetical protein
MYRLITRRRRMRRGDRRLVGDLRALERVLDMPPVSARERLDRALGPELARAVLASLDTPTARAA